jgi:hypothetical protein
MAHFDVIRNLPHAATLARRIEARLLALRAQDQEDAEALFDALAELRDSLASFEGGGDPPESEGDAAAEESAAHARKVVDEIERLGVGEDRLGQFVRNLFECLGMGEEGAEISLRAGEDPSSMMRPV